MDVSYADWVGVDRLATALKADLARYLGVSRARVTKVMSRLPL
jgi:Mn-dependent DtxR family transcriptional regulator